MGSGIPGLEYVGVYVSSRNGAGEYASPKIFRAHSFPDLPQAPLGYVELAHQTRYPLVAPVRATELTIQSSPISLTTSSSPHLLNLISTV
ncbi:hypothetical protein FRB95_004216 [Tulasnella sp. JGI-2019a]|nr:hypothetical protein FRB95_004216 [Tulasnella sp. JGI-2019a]